MAAPEFISNDPTTIINETIAYYESQTGNTLHPAQVERLLLNCIAYRESLIRGQIQAACENNLISFSVGPTLDYLVELLGVQRTQATNATCTIRFEFPTLHPGTTVPQGTRVASSDGLAVFETQQDLIIVPNLPWTETTCISVTAGSSFNGYAIGDINAILDPVPYLSSAANTDDTAGGSDLETDDQLRERARLAPDAFGTAGSRRAYQYWALTANTDIIAVGVEVVPSTPGDVNVYPLMENGLVTPSAVLTQVENILSDETVRPLTDTPNVIAPTRILYTLNIGIVIYDDADPTDVQAAAQAAVEAYALQQRQTMGRDIMSDQLIAAAAVEGVYDVDLGIFTDIICDSNEYGYASSITVTVTGTNEG